MAKVPTTPSGNGESVGKCKLKFLHFLDIREDNVGKIG
jgi:hypothetical protein